MERNDEDGRRPLPAEAGSMTRGQVARRLGVALASVRRLEGTRLHPRQGADGAWLFDPDEVESVAAARAQERSGYVAGDDDARVFELIEAGRSHSDIVRTTKLPSPVVRRLFAEHRAGFAKLDPDDHDDDRELAELDAQRARDDAELRAWEERMLALQRQAHEIRHGAVVERRDRTEIRRVRRPHLRHGKR